MDGSLQSKLALFEPKVKAEDVESIYSAIRKEEANLPLPPPPQIMSLSGNFPVRTSEHGGNSSGRVVKLEGLMMKDGRKSSGSTILMNGIFGSESVQVKVKLASSKDKVALHALHHEFKIMTKLNTAFSSRFVYPHGLLEGAKEEIFSAKENCEDFIGLVMQRGGQNLAEFIKNYRPTLLEVSSIARELLQILASAKK